MVRCLAILFPEFREPWPGGPVKQCVDLHHSFTNALVLYTVFISICEILDDVCEKLKCNFQLHDRRHSVH